MISFSFFSARLSFPTWPKLSRLFFFSFLSTQIEAWFNEPRQTFRNTENSLSSWWMLHNLFVLKKGKWSSKAVAEAEWSECLMAIIKYFYFISQKRSAGKSDEQLGKGFSNNDFAWFNWYKLDHKSKLIWT